MTESKLCKIYPSTRIKVTNTSCVKRMLTELSLQLDLLSLH